MCGIIGIIRKKGITKTDNKVWSLIRGAYENKHRGSDDGFGAIIKLAPEDEENSQEKMYILKTMLELDEVFSDRITTVPTHKDERKDKNKQLKGHLNLIKRLSDKELSFGILHHRKATYGVPIGWNEIHPFKIRDGIQYIHNGSVSEYSMLRNYLEINEKMDFKTELDSEVIAKLAEDYLENNEYSINSFKTVKRYLDHIAEFQYGILIRIDVKNNLMTIIKNDNRSLYFIEFDDSYMLVSEPLKYIDNFKNMFRLNHGVFNITSDGLVVLTSFDSPLKSVSEDIKHLKKYTTKKDTCHFCNDYKDCNSVYHHGLKGINICANCYLLENNTTVKVNNQKKRVEINAPHIIIDYDFKKIIEDEEEETRKLKEKKEKDIKELTNSIRTLLPAPNYDSPKIPSYLEGKTIDTVKLSNKNLSQLGTTFGVNRNKYAG